VLLLKACEGVRAWLLLLGRLWRFGMLLVLRHCLGDGSRSLSKLLRKLFEMLICIELAVYLEQGSVLRSQALEDGTLQGALNFESR
jgi:hypothetical protein